MGTWGPRVFHISGEGWGVPFVPLGAQPSFLWVAAWCHELFLTDLRQYGVLSSGRNLGGKLRGEFPTWCELRKLWDVILSILLQKERLHQKCRKNQHIGCWAVVFVRKSSPELMYRFGLKMAKAPLFYFISQQFDRLAAPFQVLSVLLAFLINTYESFCLR